jgi:hypothetical protein
MKDQEQDDHRISRRLRHIPPFDSGESRQLL